MRKYKIAVAVMAITLASSIGFAQERLAYQIRNGKVYYENTELRGSDPYSFSELGYGYAKDRFHVYINGEILPYVNPSNFSVSSEFAPDVSNHPHCEPEHRPSGHHKNPHSGNRYDYGTRRGGYTVIDNCVFFEGRPVSDATVSSFSDLGQGYAKDAFSAYYFGRKLEESGLNFQVLKNGYAKDDFSVWYRGQLVKE